MIAVYVTKRTRLIDDVDFLDIETLSDSFDACVAKTKSHDCVLPGYAKTHPAVDVICVKIPENGRLAELTASVLKTPK